MTDRPTTEPRRPRIHTAECELAMYRGPRVCTCSAEAAQVAAPRAEGLDVERLARAILRVRSASYRAPALRRKSLADPDAKRSAEYEAMKIAAEYNKGEDR